MMIIEKIGIGIVNPQGIYRSLSIVIPVFNKWNFTKSCLNDLAQLPEDHEIIIIDNASSDETSKEIYGLINDLRIKYPSGAWIYYIRNEENTFHSKACNQGFKLANGESILFLNNDIRVRSNHTGWTKAIIDTCNSTDGLVGPTMGLLDKNLNFVKEANQQLTGNCYLGGWCIAAKKEVWNKFDLNDGGQVWNEEFPFYFNDTDLSFRARKNKIPLTVVSVPEITHFGKVSAAQINIPKLYQEGRSVFLKKWARSGR
jgi:O-antigen biosynthesis protein